MQFNTDTPRHSRKSQRGLFHGKTHGKTHNISFSHWVSVRTQKPNAQNKSFYSEVLNTKIRVPVTTKAMKCIVKKGTFDNYILTTRKEDMNSKYGEYLRAMMKWKIKDPEFKVPTLKLQSYNNTNRRTKFRHAWKYPSIYVPPHMRGTYDWTEYMLKSWE